MSLPNFGVKIPTELFPTILLLKYPRGENGRAHVENGDWEWVEGDRFWGRETDLKIFIQRIDTGAHQLLIAQRRMGKTSLMKETARQLRGELFGEKSRV